MRTAAESDGSGGSWRLGTEITPGDIHLLAMRGRHEGGEPGCRGGGQSCSSAPQPSHRHPNWSDPHQPVLPAPQGFLQPPSVYSLPRQNNPSGIKFPSFFFFFRLYVYNIKKKNPNHKLQPSLISYIITLLLLISYRL